MKLIRKNVVELDHVLKTTNYVQPIKTRFRYATSKILKVTGAEIEEINDAFRTPEAFVEYRQKEAKVYAEFGVTKLEDINEFEEEKKQELDAKLDALKEEYSDAIDEFNALEKEKLEFLDEEVDIPVHQVKLEDMPDIAAENMYPDWEIWRVLQLIVAEED